MTNELSRTITGGIFLVGGIVLIIVGFFTMFIPWIYGVPLFIIGLFILFNNKEDSIEERKDLKKKGTKK